ncbi:MAG: AAA family ATPase [Flavobacteriaceae bacterium]
MNKFYLPKIKEVTINNFSLYKKTETINVEFNKNVFCLIGANGLGKSTFITILNYGLTGIVKNPERTFSWFGSIPQFYSKSKSFASKYFEGRVDEDDYDLAEVELTFSLGQNLYKIKRGFFEPDQLRNFEKFDNAGNPIKIDSDDPNYLDYEYKSHFVSDSNLTDFSQFAFLQSFVLTFDETHNLLFWDDSIIERVLYLFFGIDSSVAKEADKLRKDYNTFDSNARNLQWQSTTARKELNNILASLKESELTEEESNILEKHKDLKDQLDDYFDQIEKIQKEVKETNLIISDLSVKMSSLKEDYDRIFNESLSSDISLEKNPEIIQTLRDLKICIMNKKNHEHLIKNLIDIINDEIIKSQSLNNENSIIALKKIDVDLAKLKEELLQTENKKKRFVHEEINTSEKVRELQKQIEGIEEKNQNLLKDLKNLGPVDNESIIESYEKRIAGYQEKKDENYKKRDKIKIELDKLEDKLSESFIQAEKKFIPLFNNYANSFLGLPINVELSSHRKGTNLKLRINEDMRNASFQLSESQRYFIDIALRMALVELGTYHATLNIDTPEGSLDIAYESRAGKMLADFSKDNFYTIVTANINSSQLLLGLAREAKGVNMQVERMTEWTYLSEVQVKENVRIEKAYKDLEDELND